MFSPSIDNIFSDFFLFGLDGRVYRVVPQVEEEGPAVPVADEVDRAVRQVVGQIRATGYVGVFQGGDGPGAEVAATPR